MTMFIKVLLLTSIIVTSARKIPFTSKEVTQESQKTDYFNDHEQETGREEIRLGNEDRRDQGSDLNINEHDTSSETRRKSFRNIDTRAYDNLNIKNAGNDPNIQVDQYVRPNNNNRNRYNWNKGGDALHTHAYHENKNDRWHTQNRKQTTEKIHTDSRFNEKEKTTRDNEVTPKTDEKIKKPKDKEDDRWIWGIDEKATTATAVTFEDRANFAGDNCPTGQVKFNNVCVDID